MERNNRIESQSQTLRLLIVPRLQLPPQNVFYLSNIPIDFFFPFGSHRFWGEQSAESPVDDVVPFHVGSEEPSWWVMFDEVGFAFGE